MSALRPSPDDAHSEWAARVRANAEQVARYREVDPAADHDFYAPVASLFRADPRRTGDPVLEALLALARPDQVWLDVGAGGGRYALPLALHTREVIALDPSEGMLAQLQDSMREYGVHNVRVVQERWPVAGPEAFAADVVLISHLGYDVEQIGPFLDAMERAAAGGLCVAALLERPPTTHLDRLWPAVHGVARAALPALPELLALLLARGRLFEVRFAERSPQSYASRDDALVMAQQQLWVRPGSEKHRRLQQVAAERLRECDGRFAFDWSPARVGIVTWQP